MSLKIKVPNKVRRGIKARENKTFDEIIKLPSDSDSDSTQNFIALKDVRYNPATLTEISTVLDGDGSCRFEANLYVDMEAATRANVRKIRLRIYRKNPNRRVTTKIDSLPGTRQYFNERFLSMMVKGSSSTRSKGYGRAISGAANNEIGGASCKRDPSNLKTFDDGLIKTVVAPLRVTDRTVSAVQQADLSLSLNVRPTVSQQGVSANLSAPATLETVSQVYTTLITPKVNVNSTTVGLCQQVVRNLINNQPNLIDSKIATAVGTKIQESEKLLGQKALLTTRVDPTKHLNSYYASGPTAGGGSFGLPVRYSLHGTFENQVDVSKSGLEADNKFTSASPTYRQNLTTQKSSNFSGNTYLQSLYLKSSDMSQAALAKSQFTKVPIRQLTFRSSLRQHRVEFDLDFVRLQPRSTEKIYVKVELLGRKGRVVRDRLMVVDLRRQLKTLLTPNLPPTVKMTRQQEGKVSLEMEQQDPLATEMTLYRMIARPDELSESRWTRVTSLKANTRKGAVRFVDEQAFGNIDPNVVLYDVRCSGLFGTACPTTTKFITAGIKRAPSLRRRLNVGDCNIVALQKENKIEVRVSRVPEGVTRIFLRRELVNTALREGDFRQHEFVRAEGTDEEFIDVLGSSGVFVFEDTNMVNRQVYRYYAQFDWLDRERTNSIADEYIEFRRVPDRPIISYIDDVEVGFDTAGRATVSFDLAATFTNEGLDALNELLGDSGVSSIFVEELKKDRSLVSNLLVFVVTRRNTRTEETVVWPLVREGRFVDNVDSRRGAQGAGSAGETDLRSGNEYIYTARLHIVNPERFFKEALTRIPASTKQIITDTDPNFIKVSAAKFAENFAIQPGTIQSPTTLEKEVDFRSEVRGAYTGIVHRTVTTIPTISALPKNVRASRSVEGRPANVIRWEIEGSADSVFAFQVDVVVGRENTFPLRSVSPIISDNNKYEIRDELFVEEIVPVSYQVRVIYNDQSRSTTVRSNEIHGGSSLPIRILDIAIKRQLSNLPGVDLSKININTLDERLLEAQNQDPLLAGSLTSPLAGGDQLVAQTEALRNTTLSDDQRTELLIKNPLRNLLGGD